MTAAAPKGKAVSGQRDFIALVGKDRARALLRTDFNVVVAIKGLRFAAINKDQPNGTVDERAAPREQMRTSGGSCGSKSSRWILMKLPGGLE